MGQSDNIVRRGALLAVGIDPNNIGVQAASMARNILKGQKPKDIGVMPPLGTRLILNMATAKKIGLEINELAKSKASTIIE